MIARTVTAVIWPEKAPVLTRLIYDEDQPDAVRFCFQVSTDMSRHWVIGRELLANGILGADYAEDGDGAGDVKVYDDPGNDDITVIELTTPGGHAVLKFPRDDLVEFVGDSYDVVPDGMEADPGAWFDFEAAQILTAEPGWAS